MLTITPNDPWFPWHCRLTRKICCPHRHYAKSSKVTPLLPQEFLYISHGGEGGGGKAVPKWQCQRALLAQDYITMSGQSYSPDILILIPESIISILHHHQGKCAAFLTSKPNKVVHLTFLVSKIWQA